MNRFTEKLQYYINRKKISIKKLSEHTGLSRTTLKRYVEGVRIPKKKEYLVLILDELDINEKEREEMFELYRRGVVGEKKYQIGKLVKEENTDGFVLNHKQEDISMEGLEELECAIEKVFASGNDIKIALNTRIEKVYDVFLRVLRKDEQRKNKFFERVIFLNGVKDINDTVGIQVLNDEISFLKLTEGGMTFFQYRMNENPSPFGYAVTEGAVCYFYENLNHDKISVYFMDRPEICQYYFNRYINLRKNSYLYARCENLKIYEENNDGETGAWSMEIKKRKYIRYTDRHEKKNILLYAEEVISLFDELEAM